MSEHNKHLPFEARLGGRASSHVEDQLAAYTGGECSEIERAAIEQHLEGCAACRAALDETRRIRGLLAPLGTQATPPSIADAVLTRLATVIGEESAVPYLAGSSAMKDSTQSTDCPVSLSGSVPLPVAHLEPRHRRGQTSSTWRRGEGAQERDSIRMERETSTGTQTRVQWNQSRSGRASIGERSRSLVAVAAAVALVALGVGIFGLLSHRGTPGPGGHITSTPPSHGVSVALPDNSTLDGISMDSTNDGWAVGTVYNAPNAMGGAKNALLAHFDGKGWTTSPDSANFKQGMLISVSMVSADEGWAAGSIDGTPIRSLLLHFTGGHWREVDISNTGFAGGGDLHMVSANEGWLYASMGEKTNGNIKSLVIHYHNGAWQLFSSLPGWNVVSMLSANDGWAINQTTHAILRWQNGAWSQVATAAGQPLLMQMVSPTEGWIAGSVNNGQGIFAMHYDGHTWSQMALSSTGYSEVQQIAVAAPGDVWLFGQTETDTRAGKTAAWHYSMGKWTRINLDFNAEHINAASMASPSSGWVTGSHGNSAALLRYSQGTWEAVYYGK